MKEAITPYSTSAFVRTFGVSKKSAPVLLSSSSHPLEIRTERRQTGSAAAGFLRGTILLPT